MSNWISNTIVKKYSMSPDHDNKWRTGGSVDQIITESKLDPKSLMKGIKIFAKDRASRLAKS
jgi:transketolase